VSDADDFGVDQSADEFDRVYIGANDNDDNVDDDVTVDHCKQRRVDDRRLLERHVPWDRRPHRR
jgi:hypothetical protein